MSKSAVVEAWPRVEGSPVVACTAAEDMCRQEYKLQSDLSYQVQRFGVGNFAQGKGGVVDFDALDLTTAFELVRQSNEQWLSLPKVLRDRYQSWAAIEAAAASGELEQVLKAAGIAAPGVEVGSGGVNSDLAVQE